MHRIWTAQTESDHKTDIVLDGGITECVACSLACSKDITNVPVNNVKLANSAKLSSDNQGTVRVKIKNN